MNYFGYRKARSRPAHLFARRDCRPCPCRHEASVARLDAGPRLMPVDKPVGSNRLRISEALHLLVSDITPDGFCSQNQVPENRLVPLHRHRVTGLARYLTHRQETRSAWRSRLRSDDGQPLVYWKVHSMFRSLLKSAGIKPSRGRWPRIHELVTRSRSGHWSRLRLAVNESDGTCWL